MKRGVIILARFDSSRLPGKALMTIDQKPIIHHIFDKVTLSSVFRNDIVVATSDEDTDQPIVDFCNNNKINCYRGSKENVARRFLNCSIEYGFDFVARINGDNFFVDHELLDEMFAQIELEKGNFISNVIGRTFPYGMSIEIVRTEFYKQVFSRFSSKDDFEHVTKYLYSHESSLGPFIIKKNTEFPALQGAKLAIDTKDDLVRVKTIYNEIFTNFCIPVTLSVLDQALKMIKSRQL